MYHEADDVDVTDVTVAGRTVVLTLATDVSEFPSRPLDPSYPPDDRDPIVEMQYLTNVVADGNELRDFADNWAESIRLERVTHGPRPAATPSGPPSPGGGGGGGPLPPDEPTEPTEPGALVASAGADVAVEPGARVTLDGSGSSGPGGGALTFAWEQVSGRR